MAKEANASSVGNSRACSDGRSGEDECGGSQRGRAGQGQSLGVPPRWDPYAMEVDRGRNCYACGRF